MISVDTKKKELIGGGSNGYRTRAWKTHLGSVRAKLGLWEDAVHDLHPKGPCLVEHQLHFGRENAAGSRPWVRYRDVPGLSGAANAAVRVLERERLSPGIVAVALSVWSVRVHGTRLRWRQ